MSKIGKTNITIPEKVKVALAGNILNIEGPLGKKSLDIDLDTFRLRFGPRRALPSQGVSWSRSRSAVVLLSLPFLLLPLRATDVICACRWLRFLLLSSAL